MNTARNLINKAFTLSDDCFLDEIKNKIKNILKMNLFPTDLINKLISQSENKNKVCNKKEKNNINKLKKESKNDLNINKEPDIATGEKSINQTLITSFFKSNNKKDLNLNNKGEHSKTTPQKITTLKSKCSYRSIPYIKNLSQKIALTFKKYDVNDIKLTYKPMNKMQNKIFTNTKDKTEKDKQKNLVYKIDCCNCDNSYIGQTKQFIEKRIKQHKANCNSKMASQNNKTMLSSHATKYKHNFDFENPKILHKEDKLRKREIIESIYIAIDMNKVVNERKDANNMHLFYANTINSLREK